LRPAYLARQRGLRLLQSGAAVLLLGLAAADDWAVELIAKWFGIPVGEGPRP
jgi:hypothetical protein